MSRRTYEPMTVDEIVADGIKLQEKPTRERCHICGEFYTLCIYWYKGAQSRRIVRCNTCNQSFWVNKKRKGIEIKKSLTFEERMAQKKEKKEKKQEEKKKQ